MIYLTGVFILVTLGFFCGKSIEKAFSRGKPLDLPTALGVWLWDMCHGLMVIGASYEQVWPIPLTQKAFFPIGLVLALGGGLLMLTAMWEFQKIRRVYMMEVPQLVATGLYRWSRNPQYTGWVIWLAGVSLMGLSGLAFLFTVLFIPILHNHTLREEAYLEKVLGESYRVYKAGTPRYWGIPRKNPAPSHL